MVQRHQCQKSHQKDKQEIVRDCLKQVLLFEEVEVMVYGELVKMIINRKFEGVDMKGATLSNAAKGISPFTIRNDRHL